MQLVGARFGDDVHDAADRVAVLRREIVRLQAELLHGIRIRERQVGIDIGVVVTGAVELVVHRAWPGAVDSSLLLTRVNATVAAETAIAVRGIHGAGGQEHQRLGRPSIQRQVDNLALVNQLSNGGSGGGHKFGVPGNLHPLRQVAYLERDGLVRRQPDPKGNTVLNIGGKARLFDVKLIVADWQRGKQKCPCGISRSLLLQTGVFVGNGNLRAGYSRARGVENVTTEAGGGELRV